jgi:hypothetical protein
MITNIALILLSAISNYGFNFETVYSFECLELLNKISGNESIKDYFRQEH